MKFYRAELATFESGETNPEVMDLVNIEDSEDKIMCAPHEFAVGEIISDSEFYLKECNMVDDQCYGTGMFAFRGSNRDRVIEAVIERIKQDIADGDVTALDELLRFIPTNNLIYYLPEEQWDEFEFEDEEPIGEKVIFEDEDYFQIVSSGYNEELQREEVQIHAGENGNVFLIKTEEGFIIDVYGETEHVDSLTIWEDSLTSDDDDEPSGNDKVYSECEYIYNEKGYSAVIDHVEKQQKLGNPLYKDVVYLKCIECDTDTPHLGGACLVCGHYEF